MSSVLKSLPACSLLICAIAQPVWGQKKPAGAKKPAAPKVAKVPVATGDAYSDVDYTKTISGAFGLATGTLKCADPNPALPDGLTVTCSSGIQLAGKAKTSSDVLVKSAVVVTDVLGHSVELDLNFILRPSADTVIVGGPPPKLFVPPAVPVVAPPDYSKVVFTQTVPIAEGATTIAGFITPAPAKDANLSVRVWLKPEGQGEFLEQLSPPTGSTSTATVQQIAVGTGGAYSITFPAGLSAGQTVQLALVDATGKELKRDSAKTLSSVITLGPVGLEITGGAIAGSSTITGRVNMPTPAVASDPKATTPTFGNYPQIIVWVRDFDTGQWSQADLLTSATPPLTVRVQTVQSSGDFTVPLKNPLKAGQQVRVDAVPPFGRTFSSEGPLPPPTPSNPDANSNSSVLLKRIRSAVVLGAPSISTTLTEGTTVIAGIAMQPSTGVAVSVAVLAMKPEREDSPVGCLTTDNLNQYVTEAGLKDLRPIGKLLPIVNSGSNVFLSPVDGTTGGFNLTLAGGLKEDDRIRVVLVLPPGTSPAKPQIKKCWSDIQKVRYAFDWHRTNLTLVAGVLISNSSNTTTANANFSQANQFYSFNVDRAWRLPGQDCVNGRAFEFYRPCRGEGWHASRWPGINTYFEGRLTSIPVSTAAASPVMTTATTGTGTATATPTTTSLLTSQKVFRVSSGIFFPWVLGHSGGRHPNGIFFAPLVKAGFDTVTGAGTSSNVILPGNTVGTLTYQTAYNFYAFGGRIGNMELSASHDRAPKIDHYLDVTIGRYSNLQSYVCHQQKSGQPGGALPGSSCTADYFQYFPGGASTVLESRKQLFRLDFEGLVKIPIPASAIPFYIGFNANISQHTVGSEGLDHGYAPPDDIRILFGTKIDIGTLLSTLKLGAN